MTLWFWVRILPPAVKVAAGVVTEGNQIPGQIRQNTNRNYSFINSEAKHYIPKA